MSVIHTPGLENTLRLLRLTSLEQVLSKESQWTPVEFSRDKWPQAADFTLSHAHSTVRVLELYMRVPNPADYT